MEEIAKFFDGDDTLDVGGVVGGCERMWYGEGCGG
jgi:hypothetical protein